jgi:phage terminase large subunit
MKSEAIEITLNDTQQLFVSDDSAIVGMFGGLGNGKTFAGCLKAILRILDPEQPPQLGLLARQTYPELRDSTQRTFFEILHMFGLMQGHHFEYKNGYKRR